MMDRYYMMDGGFISAREEISNGDVVTTDCGRYYRVVDGPHGWNVEEIQWDGTTVKGLLTLSGGNNVGHQGSRP